MKKIIVTSIFLLSGFFVFSQQNRFDDSEDGQRVQRSEFFVEGHVWDHVFVTYCFENTNCNLGAAQARAAVKSALTTWQAAGHIYFIEVCDPANADMRIRWRAFDGPGGSLGHGYPPNPSYGSLMGDIDFDQDETWTNTVPDNFDLETSAVHEIGHTIGLAHANLASVMYDYYNGIHRSLFEDDINGIRYLYGPSFDFITGPVNFCISANYSIAEVLPPGCTLTWGTDNPLVSVSPTGQVYNSGLNGGFNLTATVSNGCGSLTLTKRVTTSYSAPLVSGNYSNSFNGNTYPLGFYPYVTNPACTGYYITTNIDLPEGSTVEWIKISSTHVVNWQQIGKDIRFYLFANNQNVLFQLTISNACGTTTKQFKWQASDCSGGGGGGGGCKLFTVSPNPASDLVRIAVPGIPAPCYKNLFVKKPGLSEIVQIERINVYDMKGNITMKATPGVVKQYIIDVSKLPGGTYYVEVISTNGYSEKQIIVISR